ncbi:hypothetical protein [Thioalkalivibrio nitratireducens]|uniref:hypothetical protein n=1 Tax=Thioalkalivibrio nitratireducens TaxID=186931 RepID=UPI0012EECDCA|nr:hypothetical protein [Thioalkalivibrio nitratireducens]
MRLQIVQAHISRFGGGEQWTAVWRPGTWRETAVFGWERKDFLARDAELRSGDMRLHLLQAYRAPDGRELWNAVWRGSKVEEYGVFAWKRDDFFAKDTELRTKTWRLHLLQAYMHPNGGELWNAVWRKSAVAEDRVFGWTYNDFREKYGQLWEQGWRVHLLQAYVEQDRILFNGVFRIGRHQEFGIYNWEGSDFERKSEEIRKERRMWLQSLSIY